MRIEQLTFTRFIAAISIVVFHYGSSVYPFNLDIYSFLLRKANLGVSYFFTLSGFVMMIAYFNHTNVVFFDFIKKRLARIYPVYFFSCIFLFFYFLLSGLKVDFINVILNIFLLQCWIPGKAMSFNTPGWSLSVELFFYLIFPFLFNLLIKFKNSLFIIFSIIFWLLSQIVFNLLLKTSFYTGYPSKSFDFIFCFPVLHLNEFLIGILTAIIYMKFFKNKKYKNDLLIILLFILLYFLLKVTFLNFHNGLLEVIFIPFILLLSTNRGFISCVFKNKISIFLGEISYSVYILQFPVYLTTKYLLWYINVTDKTLIFYFTVLNLITLSYITYKFIEIPLRKFILNKL